MGRKLSIVISEPVARGSYEAGVVNEVLEAVSKHNAQISDAEQRIEVEVGTDDISACVTAEVHFRHDEFAKDASDRFPKEEVNLCKLPYFKLRLKTTNSPC
jgi:hypothetical protein